jgi:glycerol-1-phosphate dehydrogenase [NAD(P)+]
LQSALQKHAAIPVAVGSGTINDLTKLAANRADRPYLCVATAASMDGYTAFGASITHEGSKQTFSCPPPAGVIADLDVIAAAPTPMNSWGYADLTAKVTAGADWILADALGVEPINPEAWRLAQEHLREWIAAGGDIPARNPEAIRRLLEGLNRSGLAMQISQSSRPASGAEHQFSHLWDMQHHTHNGVAPSHGFKVGIGTLAMTALYECLLQMPLENLDVDACCAAWPDENVWRDKIGKWFGENELAAVALRETRAKHDEPDKLKEQLNHLRAAWPQLRQRLREQLIPLDTLNQMLQSAGAPVKPEQIGISRQRLRNGFWQAYCIRRRFTALDLAVRIGRLEDCLDQIFGRRGVWPND